MKKQTTIILISVILGSGLLGWAIYDFYTLASQESQYYEDMAPGELNSPLTEAPGNESTGTLAAEQPAVTTAQGVTPKK